MYSVGIFFFSPNHVALWDSITAHRLVSETVSCCLEITPLSWFPPQDRSLSITLLSLFLSFIFCPTSFWRQWAAFLDAWYPPTASESCFVEVAQHSNDLLMNLWGRKWSPRPIPLQSWDHSPLYTLLNHLNILAPQRSIILEAFKHCINPIFLYVSPDSQLCFVCDF